MNNFCKYGFGKYSSIVCDCALKYLTRDQLSRLIYFLCNPNIPIKYNVLFGMVNHKYGNFVIKNLINRLILLQQQYTVANSTSINHCNTNINTNIITNIPYNIQSNNCNQQLAHHYSCMLHKMSNILNKVHAFTDRYYCRDKFSFAHNTMCLIQQWQIIEKNKKNNTNIDHESITTSVYHHDHHHQQHHHHQQQQQHMNMPLSINNNHNINYKYTLQ